MSAKPANGWTVKETFIGGWAAFPSDPRHPDWAYLCKRQASFVRACEYTYLVGPLSDEPGEVQK